jgi:hypothetical protein
VAGGGGGGVWGGAPPHKHPPLLLFAMDSQCTPFFKIVGTFQAGLASFYLLEYNHPALYRFQMF